jgi:predicted SAM-dependent methyltransferase
VFDVVLSQHVIEHLDLKRELEPLLKELHRVMKVEGEIWLTCPSIEKICKSYLTDKAESLVKGRQKRFPNYNTQGYPSSIIVNELFHQSGEHKNLFDYELLKFVLEKCGFSNIEEVQEFDLLNRFNEAPKRDDAEQTLYVKAMR